MPASGEDINVSDPEIELGEGVCDCAGVREGYMLVLGLRAGIRVLCCSEDHGSSSR